MQFSAPSLLSALLLALGVSQTVSAGGIVITPIFSNQVVPKASGDCAWGVVTPQGCASVLSPPHLLFVRKI